MKRLRMAYLSALVAGVGFFIISVIWLGVWPAAVLEEQARAFAPASALALTPSEARGREIYAREGCGYCHTQQVRFTQADEKRFGQPTLSWESRRDVPHMLGTRRIGPDLSRASGIRSGDWHLVHLFNPRLVVSQSVMPAYPWLFDGAPDRPQQSARDVVAYLETLGRARLLATDGSTSSVAVSPVSVRREGALPELPETPAASDVIARRGADLYAMHCASCHGSTMRGDGPGATGLLPVPTALSERRYTRERLLEALWHGVPGTAMPAWRDLPLGDLSVLIAHVQHQASLAPIPSGDMAVTLAEAARGAVVFANHCAQCHGPDGRGNGSAAASLLRPPTNFHSQAMSRRAVIQVLEQGVPGTMMAAWGSRLSPQDMQAVTAHLTRLFDRATQGSRP